MFDVHYHLIYDVDDGPKDIESSLNLAQASIAEGVTHIVATPHANIRYPFNFEVNQERLAILREKLQGRIQLGLGCDFHLSYENIQDLETNPQKYTVNGRQYLLVEFSDSAILPTIDHVFYRMLATGIVPVITHPERNPLLQAKPERLEKWIHSGCLVQITAGALDSRFGRKSQTMALDLVRKNLAHLVASDAHSMGGRPPAMQQAFHLLEQKFGRDTARILCIDNPAAIFNGASLPHHRVYAEGAADKLDQPPGFWKRLLGRY